MTRATQFTLGRYMVAVALIGYLCAYRELAVLLAIALAALLFAAPVPVTMYFVCRSSLRDLLPSALPPSGTTAHATGGGRGSPETRPAGTIGTPRGHPRGGGRAGRLRDGAGPQRGVGAGRWSDGAGPGPRHDAGAGEPAGEGSALRRPRFRLRTLLVAVAVAALVLGAGMMRLRQLFLRRTAAYHEQVERLQAAKVRAIEDLARAATTPEGAAQVRADAVFEARIGGYHARLKQKYRRLSDRPWLLVPPDPPPPD